ncbi:hypothetical protein [Rhizobium sp. ICMP 5592]|uniref:hypothetical protein n=1 Tax=Rhizobium sp. ICMP 5592 TaxID=2292445 RepID=UPI001297E54F|nr:hypothetical protein [Rhizobium sp. ICMP 5592]
MKIDRRKPKRLCEDWQCPIKWSCARALCRSEEYWSMSEAPLDLYKGDRNRWGCPDYQQDIPRSWLKDAFSPFNTEAPEIPDDYEGLKLVRPA